MAATYWFTAEQLQKIINRIEPQESGCWWYPAVTSNKGYATTRIGWPVTKSMSVHKLSWIYYKGDIPDGMVIDHLCHDPAECEGGNNCVHRRCVNPDHLALVSEAENSKKSVRVFEFRTHCVNGHLLDETLGATSNGKRYCTACNKEQKKESYLRLKNNPEFKARRAKNMRDLRARRKVGA